MPFARRDALEGCRRALAALALLATPLQAGQGCVACHADAPAQLAAAHRFGAAGCTACHGGDPQAADAEAAHRDLVRSPGGLADAGRSCGACHAAQVEGVRLSPMHTGAGMVRITREVLEGAQAAEGGPHGFAHLGHGPADSLLRKRCASCHLGQPRGDGPPDPVRDRGGGCLACHLDAYAEGVHPALTARVEDGRCFGCHSRSGRISLSYAGLGEIDAPGRAPAARLPDGRLVERLPPDVHHRAGLACVDCHTGAGLMHLARGDGARGIDIACEDCHANTAPRVTPADWPAAHAWMLGRLPFPARDDQPFLVTGGGTPLRHLELRPDGLWLHPRLGGPPRRVPRTGPDHPPLGAEHAALSCQSCHSTWAPQCYGCHMEFDPQGAQWDHVERRSTPGAWLERRWDLRNEPPPLGRDPAGRIDVVVPGMVMTVTHPDWEETRLIRRFATLAPHTTGRARSCADCHRSPVAMGLGAGTLDRADGALRFEAARPALEDGLPADAWTTLNASPPSDARGEARPLSPATIERLLSLPLPAAR